MKKIHFPLPALALLLTLSQSCSHQTVSMALEGEDWKNKEEIYVDGANVHKLNQQFNFGGFKTTYLQRGWIVPGNRSGTLGIGGSKIYIGELAEIVSLQESSTKHKVSFGMVDKQGATSDVFCLNKQYNKHMQLGTNTNTLFNMTSSFLGLRGEIQNTYAVTINVKNEQWFLMLDMIAAQKNPDGYAGILQKNAGEYFTLTPVNKLMGSNGQLVTMPFGSVGYEIKNKAGIAVAAISEASKPYIYFNSNTKEEDKFLLANVCLAIFLE
jgi:hypothetical protein